MKAIKYSRDNDSDLGRFIDLSRWEQHEPNREAWKKFFERYRRQWGSLYEEKFARREQIRMAMQPPGKPSGWLTDLARYKETIEKNVPALFQMIMEIRTNCYSQDWYKLVDDFDDFTIEYMYWMIEHYPNLGDSLKLPREFIKKFKDRCNELLEKDLGEKEKRIEERRKEIREKNEEERLLDEAKKLTLTYWKAEAVGGILHIEGMVKNKHSKTANGALILVFYEDEAGRVIAKDQGRIRDIIEPGLQKKFNIFGDMYPGTKLDIVILGNFLD